MACDACTGSALREAAAALCSPAMTRTLVLWSLLGGILLLPGLATPGAADKDSPRPVLWRYNAPSPAPFPRSERAQTVRAEIACWNDCGAHCTWGIAACLRTDAQGHCLKLGDACDRYCQRACRTQGGPLLPDIFDAWE
jgi:hypothetical protein